MDDIKHNLKSLRKMKDFTLEDVAEKLGVSRQTVAKWEKGDTVPDIENCIGLAEIYGVTVDSLVRVADSRGEKIPAEPVGKHIFGMVRVNDKGQITLPRHARKIFNIGTGDFLLVLGDEERGIAIVKMTDGFEMPKMNTEDWE